MILTSHFDESGTHAGEIATVMAGIMGNARQWIRFENRLDELKRRYGFDVFHAKDFKARSGEFRGWPDERYPALLMDLMLAGSDLMEAVTCSLPNDAYKLHYRGSDTPRKLRLDTAYGLCFRYALTHLVTEAIRRLGTHKKFSRTTMHVVLENGHKNAGDAERIFYEAKKELQGLGCNLLATITFADKNQCAPLMVADYLAHGTLMLERAGENDTGPSGPPLVRRRGETGMAYLQFNPDGLALLKAQLVEGLKRARDRKLLF